LYSYLVMMNPGLNQLLGRRVLLPALCLLLCHSYAIAQARNLDFFINAGLANSPLLHDLSNQVAASSIDSQRLRATYHPIVTGTSNNFAAPIINGWGYDEAITNRGGYATYVGVNENFVGRNNLNAQKSLFRLLKDSISFAQKISEQDLKRAITAQYITAYGDLEQLNFYLEVNGLLREQEIILKKLTTNNVYRQTDYLAFMVTLRQQELQLKQIRITFRSDYSMLYYLCGLADTTTSQLDMPDINLQHLPDEYSSVFFQKYRRDSLALKNSITILNYSYHPKLSAFANAGYNSTLLYHAEKNFGFSAGFNLAVPIYDGHQKKLLTQKINLQENTRTYYQDFFKNQRSRQIAMLKEQLAATESLITDINDQIKFSRGLIDVNGRLLQTGDAKIPDFIIAINNYLTAKNLFTQNKISRMQIINQINYWNR
jgi:outer membrane protein TolC